MDKNSLEIEVKIPIADAKAFAERIAAMGPEWIRPLSFERNLRFDDKDGSLTASHQVLRLRYTESEGARITWKAPREKVNGIAVRTEYETEVKDFDIMQAILEGMGYSVCFFYEKERAIFGFGETTVFTDHTPIGDFIEIEGPDEEAIRERALSLGLDWSLRSDKSYVRLFKEWKNRTGYSGRDMVFDK